jgi:hypothetical protein
MFVYDPSIPALFIVGYIFDESIKSHPGALAEWL